MPVNFRHLKAPYKKLRLPEWYVPSLMMDRALDAIMRQQAAPQLCGCHQHVGRCE
jgi:hypothetical protein